MSNLPSQLSKHRSDSKGEAKSRKWFKRWCRKILRRSGKKVEDPETDLQPKPRYMDWW